MTVTTHSEEETRNLGKSIAMQCKPGTVISLRGSLGSGKTVFAKGLAEGLGIGESIVSPTFTLIQEYEGSLPLYHMDLYRIEGIEEFEMIGGEELLYGKGVTLIEWSEKVEELLPDSTIFVHIRIMPNQERIITLEGVQL
ncbi:tRNA (adenosine(37)-N6)-threonylcarbamoyltransferase complex ATPase subunit type 1 TsaE [uncultured Sphaerochaeta sp.]|uniref:tRNA (adenosine(37)-N6)-threonylcarbamoyltransferase complex ATPase subunit type 1 TsaE n=1 Tax=uncultured Sphaerochaeta sp. TaxID=886478 RepID=UPI002A0A5F41|nr:tRNA (adenosine(37)-N6)-threonylcarbamoyltransferase complex ATPase subunit type 1 TsaE [uncultured Sphaerochaeta sp.]